MSTSTRRVLVVAAALVIAAILAFPLRDTLYDAVIVPIAFIGWNLGLLYRSLSQGIWWWVIVFVVLFILVFSLVPQSKLRRRTELRKKPALGPVEGLAISMQKAERGIYFKWLVANRLGRLAYQILLHRESGRPRSVFAPLLGNDWEPSRALQTYLEIGLHGSFADFPHVRRPFGAPLKTPLDHDVHEAIEFLELQVENNDSPRTHRSTEIL